MLFTSGGSGSFYFSSSWCIRASQTTTKAPGSCCHQLIRLYLALGYATYLNRNGCKDTHKSHIFFLPAEPLLDRHQYFPSAPTMPEKCTARLTFSLLNMVCLSQLIPGPFALPDSCLGGGHWLSQSVQPSVWLARRVAHESLLRWIHTRAGWLPVEPGCISCLKKQDFIGQWRAKVGLN